MLRVRSRIVVAIVACLLLGACKTLHLGPRAGAAAQQLTANTYRIVARGGTSVSSASIADVVLWKAASVTKAAGATHFVVESKTNTTRVETVVKPGYERKEIVGDKEIIDRYESSSKTYTHPGINAVIRVLTVQPGRSPPSGAYQAEEILLYVSKRVKPA